jgi:hypothetical protein
MPKILYGEIITQMRGKGGGHVYARNAYGDYWRHKTIPTNPRTLAQGTVRAFLANASQQWRQLSQAERDAWDEATASFIRTNVFGLPQKLTGFNLYMSLARNAQEIGIPILTAPPNPITGFQIEDADINVDFGTTTMQLTFSPAIPGTSKVILYATPPMSAGRKNLSNMFRKIAVLDSTDTSPYDFKNDYLAKFGLFPNQGAIVQCKLVAVDTNTAIASGAKLTKADAA